MSSTSEAALMGMLGAFCHWGVFINKVNYPSDEEIVFYVTIPEKSFGYVNNGLVDMSTPEKFIKNIKEKLIDPEPRERCPDGHRAHPRPATAGAIAQTATGARPRTEYPPPP